MEGGTRPVRAIADCAAQTNLRRSVVADTDWALRGNRNPFGVRIGAGIGLVSTETDRCAPLGRLNCQRHSQRLRNSDG